MFASAARSVMARSIRLAQRPILYRQCLGNNKSFMMLSRRCSPFSSPFSTSPSSSSSSSSSGRDDDPGSGGVLGFVQKEVGHLTEQLKKSGAMPSTRRRRVITDLDGVDWNEVLLRHQQREIALKEQKEKAADDLMGGEESADGEGAPEYEGTTALVTAEGNQTVWEKRIERLKDSIRASLPFSAARKAKRLVHTSENELLQKVRQVQEDLANRREDFEEAMETTQNPMVLKLRDTGDAVFGESEEAWALGELLKVDPDFQVHTFAEHMQEYMVPVVLEAFLEGNAAVLEVCTDGQARNLWQSAFKDRIVKGEVPDSQILDLDMFMVDKIMVVDHTPYVVFKFVAQQVNCTRSIETGEVVSGHEADIRQVAYQMAVSRDYDSEVFDWKIHEMQFHQMMAIT